MLLSVSAAQASVIVLNDASESSDTTGTVLPATSATLSGFDLMGGSSLVVVISGEGNDLPTSSAVTFDGASVLDYVLYNEGPQTAAVYWLNSPASTSGDVVITLGDTQTAHYTVAALALTSEIAVVDSNGFGVGNADLPYDLSYTGEEGGLVISSFADNIWNGGSIPTITGGNVDTVVDGFAGTSSDSAGRVIGYGDVAADGSYTETYTAIGSVSSSRNAGVLVSFVAVPEPSAFLLVCMGALTIATRRQS